MNLHRTILLALILVVLAGVATVMEKNRKKNRAPSTSALFPEFSIDAVDRLEIEGTGGPIRLSKQDGIWMIASETGDHTADPVLVSNILDKLVGLNTSNLVSGNAAKHNLYDVDDLGVEVKAFSGEDANAWFIVGKAGPDRMSTYIRRHDDDRTYRVPVYLLADVSRGDRPWRDQNILKLDRSNIASYTYSQKGEVPITLTQSDAGVWMITEPETRTTDASVMEITVESLTNIRATGFADTTDAETAGLVPPKHLIEVRLRNNTTHVIEVGEENETRQAYSRLRGTEQIFLVPMGRWNTIFRTLDQIGLVIEEGVPGSDD